MIDCGMFQERPFVWRNWEPPPIEVRNIDFLLLTHAHLDHCGVIPRLVQQGYSNPILATAATIELTRIVLADSAKIQEEDAATKQRRHQREHRRGPHPAVPLYGAADADRAMKLFREVPFDEPIRLNDRVEARFRFAGHILGSSCIEIACRENGHERRIVFSGDVGQYNRPLLHDPQRRAPADYVVMESTYGDSIHDETVAVDDRLEEVINDTASR